MNVGNIMTSPAPQVAPETEVTEVARIVLQSGAGGVAVVGPDGEIMGLVTENDLVAKHARVHAPRYLGILGGILPLNTRRTEEELRHILGVTARDLMTRDVPLVPPDMEVDDAATLMVDQGTSPLVVVDGSRVLGLLSQANVIQLLVLEEQDEASVEGD